MIDGVLSYKIELLNQENVGLAWKFMVNPNSCNNPTFYQQHLALSALHEQKVGLTTTHVVIDTAADRIMGFVSLRASSVLTRHESGRMLGEPALEISVLAVDAEYERRGVGKTIMLHVIGEAIALHEQHLGIRGIILAADPKAVSFYEHMHFVRLDDSWDSDIPRELWNIDCKQMYMELNFDM